MNRRTMLYGGIAALAGLAGVGAAWWKFEPRKVAPLAPPSGAGLTDAASDAFWGLSFDTPDGNTLPMSSFRGKMLLVNFWATWCPPCIEELPLLERFFLENKDKNWQVLGLAVDQPEPVRAWLHTRPLSFPVGMAGLAGAGLSKSLGNTVGALPFSVVFGASGALLHHKIGKVLPEELALWSQRK